MTPVVYPAGHRRHTADTGTWVGKTIPSDEVPERVEVIVSAMRAAGHQIVDAVAHDDTVLESVHDPEMIAYMREAHANWVAAGYDIDPGQPHVTAYAFPTARFLSGLPLRLPASPGALAGVYAMDTMTQIGEGTFEGARAAIDAAQTAADLVAGGVSAAYAACRPPGHHAGRSFFGGSCYLNNAAVAAQSLRDSGSPKVAIVDLDAHHGNGTQQIFFERDDVFYGSVHVDPGQGWFPHFVGYADELGSGRGSGANLNVPVPAGSGDDVWLAAVARVAGAVESFRPSALVVSLGVDAAISDPESPLLISERGFEDAGARLGALGLPTVIVQEGGYDLSTIADLVIAFVSSFEAHREAGT
jgi:acetoin utilization deacetylase AcuC-like enzyme